MSFKTGSDTPSFPSLTAATTSTTSTKTRKRRNAPSTDATYFPQIPSQYNPAAKDTSTKDPSESLFFKRPTDTAQNKSKNDLGKYNQSKVTVEDFDQGTSTLYGPSAIPLYQKPLNTGSLILPPITKLPPIKKGGIKTRKAKKAKRSKKTRKHKRRSSISKKSHKKRH